MTAKLQATAAELLSEDFQPEDMHPADIEQVLVNAWDEYQEMPKFTKVRSQYRKAYNKLVDLLTEKRGFAQFGHIQK